MKRHTSIETNDTANIQGKKEWCTPIISKLQINKTSSLSWSSNVETGGFIGFFGTPAS